MSDESPESSAPGAQRTGAALEMAGIVKHFGGSTALQDASIKIEAGTIHALIGENGAGKSTLGKIIAGVHSADEGRFFLDGQPRRYRSPRQALDDGVTLVAQEVVLVPRRSVAENVFLGDPPRRFGWVDTRSLGDRYQALVDEVGFTIPGDALVGDLRLADQQQVEILRGIARGSRLMVMDEPTAALTSDEAGRLFDIVRTLRDRGTTIIYISHFLKEVLALADTITVLRDGRVIETVPAHSTTETHLITSMIGRSLGTAFPPRNELAVDAPVMLKVDGLQAAHMVNDVSFSVRAGEILGIGGLIGSGRSEVAHTLIGSLRRTDGTIELAGQKISPRSPAEAKRCGLALLPESRKSQGLVLARSILENVSLPHISGLARFGVIERRRERRAVEQIVAKLGVRAPNVNMQVVALSGGNQQKTMFAKWLLKTPRVLIADEPTRGVDVGAKRAIYDLIIELAAEGMAIILISSELEEVVALSHRVCVMREGTIVKTLGRDEISGDAIMTAAFGAAGLGGGA